MALLSCPECKKQISDQAPACLHCGYPIKATVQSKSKLTQDIEDVKTVGAWLAFFITLPTLAVPAVISTLLDNPGQFDEEAIKILWDTFLLTAPLTCAIALIGIWITPIIEKYSSNDQTPTYSATLGIGIGILFSLWLAAQISQSLLNIQGVDVVTITSNTNASGPLKIWMSLWNIFVEYFRLYGFHKFLSSCAIGVFLGWIWNSKILAYFRN
jgi:zinc-ribbon domain